MSFTLRVRWTLIADRFPEPWRACARCGAQRPFRCSGKFRLNANGRRLDAWLVYKCSACDDTWNHTLFERRNAHDIDVDLLSALESNDPKLARRCAFDVIALRRNTSRVEEFANVAVRKERLDGSGHAPTRLEIVLAAPDPVSLRLDRLLAMELGLSRSRMAALADRARIRTTGKLNRAVRDGLLVEIELDGDSAAEAILRNALPE